MARAQPIIGIDPDNDLLINATLILPVRVAELVQWEKYMDDPLRVYELHQMRIAAKRLRYTMEIVAKFYGEEFGRAIDRVKQFQEMLGQIHDADVLVPLLAEHARRCLPRGRKRDMRLGVYAGDVPGAAGLVSLCRRKRAEREQLYQDFRIAWRKARRSGLFERIRAEVLSAAFPLKSTGHLSDDD